MGIFLGQGKFRCITRKRGGENRKHIINMLRIRDAEADAGRRDSLLGLDQNIYFRMRILRRIPTHASVDSSDDPP